MGYRPAIKKPKYLNANLHAFRSKAGPNGHALSSSIADANMLTPEQITDIMLLGGPKLQFLLNSLRYQPIVDFFKGLKNSFIKTEGTTSRRISCFNDKEDKVRYIGILD